MINVKATILCTIKEYINKLRFLGKNDPKIFKNILYLIVLDDLFDWSAYLEDSQHVQKQLRELRTTFILQNPEFNAINEPENYYVNVNTPQTHYTWKRIWDAPKLDSLDESKVKSHVPTDLHPKPFKPDSTCPVQFVYFPNDNIKENNGEPYVDFDTLTICEKMNIYINKETKEMYYLDPEKCQWVKLSTNEGGIHPIIEDKVINITEENGSIIWNLGDKENNTIDVISLEKVRELV